MQLLVLLVIVVTLADFRLICGYRNKIAQDASKLNTLCDFLVKGTHAPEPDI